ncbi:mucin-binding protein [Lactobacillus crispatus]|uniref:mucin-binding protein n=1 Tax=Lactobacillus crispatus TaxID=47770 RepID=UPI0022CE2A3D|nr:LPXTG cell wall anchor domain-containing protein [Lactobacillus crispatus]MCZ9662109.1 LPXTG cell wall anchor domain-containing protein [Lactobacillus crispatus]
MAKIERIALTGVAAVSAAALASTLSFENGNQVHAKTTRKSSHSSSHSSGGSHSSSRHSSGGSHSSSRSKVDHDPTNSKMNHTIIDGINKAKASKSGTYVEWSGHGKNRHKTTYYWNGHVIINSGHTGHKYNNGSNQEEWNALNNGTIISNNDHYGSHPGESLTDSNNHHYTIQKGQTVHTSDGRTWTWDTQSGHVVEVKDNGQTVDTGVAPDTNYTPTDNGSTPDTNYTPIDSWNHDNGSTPHTTPRDSGNHDNGSTPHTTPTNNGNKPTTPTHRNTTPATPNKGADVKNPTTPSQIPDVTTNTGAKQTATVPINYVDDTTGKVVKTDNLSGEVGTTNSNIHYSIPDGYKYVSGEVPSYTFKDKDNQPIIVHVTKNSTPDAKTVSVPINYVDDSTGKVVKTDNLSGKVGTTDSNIHYSIPDGYKYVSGEVPSYTFKDKDNQPITVHVTKGTEDVVKVPINYIDKKTGKVVKTTVIMGKPGDTSGKIKYSIPAGYKYVSGEVPSYTFQKDGKNKPISVFVTKTDDNGNKPVANNNGNKAKVEPAAKSNNGSNGGAGTVASGQASQARLPQTGDSRNSIVLASGVATALVAGAGIVVAGKKKRLN